MAGILIVSSELKCISHGAVTIPNISDDTGSATENDGEEDDDDDIDLNSDVVAALLDGNSEDGQVNNDDNDSWEDIDVQEENL